MTIRSDWPTEDLGVSSSRESEMSVKQSHVWRRLICNWRRLHINSRKKRPLEPFLSDSKQNKTSVAVFATFMRQIPFTDTATTHMGTQMAP